MPRRKRNRRRHGRNKKKRQTTTIKNRASSKPNNTTNTDSSMQTCNSDEHNISCTLVNNDFMTPKVERVRKDSFEMETPVRKLQPKDEADDLQNQTADLFQNNYTPLRGTPVNKRRSLNRHKDGTLNVTNLNVLFDSNEATPIRRTSLIVKNNRTPRSHSSIPVLHSPGKEALVSFNKSTQTMDEELIVLDITETPKMSQKTHDKSNMSIKTQSNYTKNFYNQKINDMNVNPHLKDKEIANIKSQWQKESSLEELSFFSPQLYEMKTSSTPIQGQVVNYLKENDTKISLINKKLDGTPLNRDIISKTPRSAKLLEQVLNNSIDLTIMDSVPSRLDNVNLNTPPLTEKVINKDKSNSIRLLGSSKKKKRTSPKINRLVNHSRVFTKNLSRSTISSRRLSLEHSCEARSPTAGLGVYEKMVNKIKRYSKASVKWSGRMMESCAQLGIQIKNSLSSLCDMYNEKSMLESSQSQKSCQCDSLKQEIVDLNVKIDHLTEEVGHLRQQIRENHNDSQANGYHNNYQILNENLDKVKQELTTFKDLRSELTTLKEMFQCFKNTAPPPTACSVTKPPAAPPVPAPPPPPPPPPPPMPLITVPPKLNLQKKSKSTIGMTSTDNSRPVISLDDILKVKLKKASERPASTPNCRHRNISTPMCSTGDLFRQIKLRSGKPSFLKTPAINQTSASTPGVGTTTADLTTSPANSLNKFLENTSVWRVKRLKKVGAYSFDNSVHRRTMLALSPASRRERPAN